MVGAEDDRRLDVDDRVAREDARFHRLADALFDRGDELAGDDPALGAVDEGEAGAGLLRLEAQDHVPVLPAAARLADVLRLLLDGAADRLFVRDLRLANVGVDLELAE